MMTTGLILSQFHEQRGFIPVVFSSSTNSESMVKDIIFRSTLNLVGGTKNISEERESFLELPDHQIIGCSYLKSVESTSIRGGIMPIILILFTSNENKINVYHNLLQIMEDLKGIMIKILPYWKDTKFSSTNAIKGLLNNQSAQFESSISKSSGAPSDSQENKFVVECPECSQQIDVFVPSKIPNLWVVPIANAPCKHNFEAYFTKGPQFRGTSKSVSESDNGLKDIFNNL